ncbi:MAG: TonB-dependent receptor [Flavobacteriia bacterium]|nr:TonB-dependent receptor [Flavobacteriia bacterium]
MKKLLLATLSIISLGAYAQSAISGQAVDEMNIPLPGAVISLDGSTTTVSDLNGRFSFVGLSEGEHTVVLNYTGYKSVSQDVTLSGKNVTIALKTSPNTTVLGEIEVIGSIGQGQAKALNRQRTNTNATNVVSSDQVGRFPDANIGDAMKRISGITMQNDQGEARNIIVRGLAPQLNSVTINGERIPSAEGDNRNIQMDLIPADMIQTIEVSKSLTPDMDADAIGGSVNLVTRAVPGGRRIAVTGGLGYNTLRQAPVMTGSFTYGSRFANDKLGVVVSYSGNDNIFGSDNAEMEWVIDESGAYIENYEVRQYNVRRLRQSLSANLDLRIAPGHTLFLQTIHNNRKDWENRFRLRYKDIEPDGNGGYVADNIRKQTKAGGPDEKYARLENQTTFNYALRGEHLFGKLRADWSTNIARAEELRPNERYMQMRVKNAEVAGAFNPSDTRFPIVTPVSKGLNLEDFSLHELTEQQQNTYDLDMNARLDFTLPVGNGMLKFGGRSRNKTKVRELSFSEFEYVGDEPELAIDGELMADRADRYMPGDYWNYASALDYIAGVRAENTVNKYTGFAFDVDDESVTQRDGEGSYTNVLPSVLFKYSINPMSIVRAAITSTIARPNYYDLVPYAAYSTQDLEADFGNSGLLAARASNVDLSYEKYLKGIGFFSIGGFYKNISDFIYTEATDIAYNGETYDATQPQNGDAATVVGMEVAFQRQLDFLPGLLKNLSFYGNTTFTNSTTSGIRSEALMLAGTAPFMLNGSLAYETEKLTIRASLNHSAGYVDEYGKNAFYDRYYGEQTFLDVNAYYAITPKIRLFVEVNNLLNQPLRYYQYQEAYTMQMEYYGIRGNVGIKLDL